MMGPRWRSLKLSVWFWHLGFHGMRLFSWFSSNSLALILGGVFFLIIVALAFAVDQGDSDPLLKHDSFESSPAIISAPVIQGSTELTYTYPVEISNIDGFPVEFALDLAPAGMTIDMHTGLIEWPTPQVGLHDVTVLVWDTRAHFDEQSYTLQIIENVDGPEIVSSPLLTVRVNTLYDYLPEIQGATNLPLNFELLTHPAGMTIDPNNGRIRWQPSVEGDVDVSWKVTDALNASDQQGFTLSVQPAAGNFSVGGRAAGLDLTEVVVLETVSGQRLKLTSDGSFNFLVDDGENYEIVVDDQSSTNAICYVTESSGQVVGGNVDNVLVQCVPGSANPEVLIEEAEQLADSGVTISTEEFGQTDYAQNQLSEAESRKIDRNHALVIAAVDPDPDWISTGFDSDRIIVTEPDSEHTINAIKLDIDFNEIGPIDADRLKFEIRIQRTDHEFEWLPREFATDIVDWTGEPGQFTVHVPDDLTRGRLAIGLRPDFDDVGQTAIAERWSEALLFEIWPVRAGVIQLEASDVLFPLNFEQPLDPTSNFSLADIQSSTSASGEVLLPLVLAASVQVSIDDLLEYQIGSDPYSGRVASIEERNGQKLILLHPDWMDVYDIADADDDFMTDQGVLPELVTYRIGDRIAEFDEPYRRFDTSLELDEIPTADADSNISVAEHALNRRQRSQSNDYFIKRCESGDQNAVLAISPRISIAPFDARIDVSVATGGLLFRINCTWDANPNKRFPNALKFAGPAALIAAKVLGTEVTPQPIGQFSFRNDADLGAIEAIKISFSTRNGIKNNVPSDLANYIDFHSLEGNPVSISSKLGGNVGIGVVANAFGTRGILGKLASFFSEDLIEIGIEFSATTGLGLAVSGANAGAVYRGEATTKAGFKFNLCAKLQLSRALRNLLQRLVSVDPSIELCFNEEIPIGDPSTQFAAGDLNDDLQGNATVGSLTALPALASFFGFTPTGRLAPDDSFSSVYNDVHNEIKYDLTECDNNPSGTIETPVIACAGPLCGETEPIKLCANSLWVNPIQAQGAAGETVMAETDFGLTSRRDITDPILVEVSGSPLISDRNFFNLTESRTQRTIQATAECGPSPSIERGEIIVQSGFGPDMLEARNLNLLSCRCEPGSKDCDRVWGSPHLVSPDGLALDYYASGDYLLAHVPGMDGMQIQARYLPGMGVSWPQAVALEVGTDVIEIHSQVFEPSPFFPRSHLLRLRINGIETVRQGQWLAHVNSPIINLPGGGLLYINQFIRRFGGRVNDPISITVLWPKDSSFQQYGVTLEGLAFDQNEAVSGDFENVPPILEISLVRPDEFAGMEAGMLGNNDGDPSNDMQLRNGTEIQFTDNLSWTELYALFGASWLVRPYECLFANGCIDPEFPLSPEPIDPDRRQFAEAACFGLQGWYREACIHDVALSGSTELVKGLYENTEELNSMADRLVLPGVDIPLFALQPGAVEKVGFKELYNFSVELVEGQGEYALSLVPPRGTTAVLASTGEGSLVDSQPRVDSVELTCIPNTDWQELGSAWPEQGSLQLWAIDPLSGSPRTLLGEIILPAERIGEYCTDLRHDLESTFLTNAQLALENVGPEPLTVRIEPEIAIELAPVALNDLSLCAGCDVSIDLAHQCTGGIQRLGSIQVLGSDGTLQESRPLDCKTIASTVTPLLDMDNDFQGQTEVLFIDGNDQLWDLHNERDNLNNPHPDLFWSDLPVPIHSDAFAEVELVQVVSGGSSSGNPHSLALDSEGRVWAWGYNNRGQLGWPSCSAGDPEPCINRSDEPILVSPSHFSAPLVQIAGSDALSFALDSNGQVWSWGTNSQGALGNTFLNPIESRSIPQIIQFGGPQQLRITAIAAGSAFGIALDENGQIWSWGSNIRGQLGQGFVSFDSNPIPVAIDINAFDGAKPLMISAGNGSVIVLNEFGQLWGWGSNRLGELSQDLPLSDLSLPQFLSTGGLSSIEFSWVTAAHFTTLARSLDGRLWTWGANFNGELGVGDFEERFGPELVDLSMLGDASVQFADMSGSSVGLVYDTEGRFWTWGSNIMMPSFFRDEPKPVLLADNPSAELEIEIKPLVAGAQLDSASSSHVPIAVAVIEHKARELQISRRIRLADPRLEFVDSGSAQLDIPRLRTTRVSITGRGDELCIQPGYYPVDIDIVDDQDQVLAQSSISLECRYPLEVRLDKGLDQSELTLNNRGGEDLFVTVEGLDGLSHDVLNSYEHTVCAGCELDIQIQEVCPIIGRLLLARIEVRDVAGQFSERRDLDCGRANSVVAVHGNTSFIVDSDGQPWGWGVSNRLGSGPGQNDLPTNIETPILLDRSMLTDSGFGLMSNFPLSPSPEAVFSIDRSGYLWSWGNSGIGELGNGTHRFTDPGFIQTSPERVTGSLAQSHITSFENGRFPLGVDDHGRVWGWGSNRNLLTGNTVPSDQIFPMLSELPIITRALTHNLRGSVRAMALSTDGFELWAWGGQGGWLFPFQGAGTADACWPGRRDCPPTMTSLDMLGGVPARDIVAGLKRTYLLDGLGRVWHFDNTSSEPPELLDLTPLNDIRVIGITTGLQSTFSDVLDATYLYDEQQRLWAIGANSGGVLGVDSNQLWVDTLTQIVFPDEAGRIVELAVHESHVMAVDENHCFWGWGTGGAGSPVGTISTTRENAPVTVLNDFSPICVTPELHVGTPISTPAGVSTQLDIHLSAPYSRQDDLEISLQVLDEQIATLSKQTLTIPASETGPSQPTQIEGVMPGSTRIIVTAAAPEIAPVDSIASVSDPNNQGFSSVTAGANHSCAIRNDGFLTCWGLASDGRTLPPNQIFTVVSAGSDHNCGIDLDGATSCWGRNNSGKSDPPLGSFTDIAAGVSQSCGIRSDQTIACWGSDFNGVSTPPNGLFIEVSTGNELSCGLTTDQNIVCWGLAQLLTDVPTGEFHTISAGRDFACAIREPTNEVVCWGDSSSNADEPPAVPMQSLSAGTDHACGIQLDSSAICWGLNIDGQSNPPSASTVNLIDIASGFRHSCALNEERELICWGNNNQGQLNAP